MVMGLTEAHVFQQVKDTVDKWCDLWCTAIDYSRGVSTINLVCDTCITGGSGVVLQGNDFQTANIIAIWSGKFNPTQQNYPVHKQELLSDRSY